MAALSGDAFTRPLTLEERFPTRVCRFCGRRYVGNWGKHAMRDHCYPPKERA